MRLSGLVRSERREERVGRPGGLGRVESVRRQLNSLTFTLEEVEPTFGVEEKNLLRLCF